MKRSLLSICICHLALAAGAAAVPMADTVGPGPGLCVPLDLSVRPDTHGKLAYIRGQWTFPDGQAAHATTPPTCTLGYRITTADRDEAAELPSTQDWIVQIERVQIAGSHNAAQIRLHTSAGEEEAILMVAGGRMDGRDLLFGGNGADMWHHKADFEVSLNEYHTFTFHYSAAAGGVDFWLDDTLIVSGVKSRCGKYDLGEVKVEAERGDVIAIRHILATQNVPEPAMLSLVVIHCLGLGVRPWARRLGLRVHRAGAPASENRSLRS